MPIKANVTEQVLIDLITKDMSCSEILEELNISKSCLYSYLRKYNLHIPTKLSFDNTVFDLIDTDEKAYWLGFLYADGYVSNGKYNNTVELSLKEEDYNHLCKFNKFLKHTKDVKITTGSMGFNRCRCLVSDKHFRDRLVSLGCIPNKSLILSPPDINIFSYKELKYSFIRGYMDGDGSFSKNKYNKLRMIY